MERHPKASDIIAASVGWNESFSERKMKFITTMDFVLAGYGDESREPSAVGWTRLSYTPRWDLGGAPMVWG